MKTKEELNALKEEVEALTQKLTELTGEELAQVVGGNENEISNDGTLILTGGKLDAGKNATGIKVIQTRLGELRWYNE